MEMKMKHEGRALYRLKENPMERKFHNAWKAEQEYGLLEYLFGDGTHKGEVTDRDAQVAATVIQWLGSPVGQNFVKGVMSPDKSHPVVTTTKIFDCHDTR